jgi:hypothetical protein
VARCLPAAGVSLPSLPGKARSLPRPVLSAGEGGREGERESFIRNRGDGRVAGACHEVCERKSATMCCCHCVGRVLAVTSSNKGSGPLRVFRVEKHLSLIVARLVRYIQW